MSFNYWEEALAESLDEHGVTVTTEQLAAIAKDMGYAHETIDQAFHTPEDPTVGERERLAKELADERRKITCRACNGTGEDRHPVGTSHESISRCDRCNGNGRHAPWSSSAPFACSIYTCVTACACAWFASSARRLARGCRCRSTRRRGSMSAARSTCSEG